MNEEAKYYSLTKRVFDILAPYYDLVTLPISGLRDRVVDMTNAKAGSTILDVATGTGEQAIAFARHSYDVNGIDITETEQPIRVRKGTSPFQAITTYLAKSSAIWRS